MVVHEAPASTATAFEARWTAKIITERFALTPGRVDRSDPARPVVRDVALCGPLSANKRRYLKTAFEGDRLKRYEGRPIYLNHAGASDGRRYEDKIARAVNVRRNAAGLPVGDLAVNPKHPLAEAFLWDAEHAPDSCGMSHVARCETRAGADGWEEVTEVVEVESIDVVTDPATTKGLYRTEHRNRGRAVNLTVKALAEALVKHPKTKSKDCGALKALAEMDGMDAAPVPMDAPPAEDADPMDGVSAAFKSAVMAIIEQAMSGDMDAKEALSKVKKLLASHGEINGKAPDTSADTPPDTGTEESKRRGIDYPALLRECRAANFAPSDLDLKSLTALSESERREYIADRAKGTGETPISTGRVVRSENKGDKAGPLPTGREFVASFRE